MIDAADQGTGLGAPRLLVGDERALAGERRARTPEARALFGGEFRDLLRSPNASGGYMVPAGVANEVWDALRARAVVLQAGVREIATDKARLTIPRITGDVSVAWTPEATTIAESQPTLGGVEVVPRKLAALVEVSSELVDDAEPDVLRMVEDNLAASIALEVDRVFLEGTGVGEEPTGLLNTSGVQSATLGAGNGAALALDDVQTAVSALATANARASAIFMHPRTWGALTRLKTGVSGDLRYLLQSAVESGTGGVMPSIWGVPVFATSKISAARTVGSSTTCANLYAVDTSQVALVRRSDLRIEVDRSVGFARDVVTIRAICRLDVAVPQPQGVYYISAITS